MTTGKRLARDERLPRWLRGLFVFGCLPIPFMLDEVALVVAVTIMAVGYRPVFRTAWEATR